MTDPDGQCRGGDRGDRGGDGEDDDSRIILLAELLERHMPLYFPGGVPSAEAERRVILAVAAEVLPDPWPPSPAEAALARLVRLCLLGHRTPPAFPDA